MRAVALFLIACEECGERHVERAGERLKAVDRRRHRAVLDLGKHACRQPGLIGELGAGQIELAAEIAHLRADRPGNR
jgi:hypothetical protein